MPALMPQSSRFTVPLSGIAGNPLPGNRTGRKRGEAGPSRRWRGVSLPQENQAIGKSKGGMTTKILALTDALGNLVRFELLPGNRFDTIGVAPLIKGVKFGALLADKAFDSNWIIETLTDRGAKIVISQHPRRTNRWRSMSKCPGGVT